MSVNLYWSVQSPSRIVKRECELMSRILLDDQIVGDCNEFLHKLQVDRGPERVKMFYLRRHVCNIFSFNRESNGKC